MCTDVTSRPRLLALSPVSEQHPGLRLVNLLLSGGTRRYRYETCPPLSFTYYWLSSLGVCLVFVFVFVPGISSWYFQSSGLRALFFCLCPTSSLPPLPPSLVPPPPLVPVLPTPDITVILRISVAQADQSRNSGYPPLRRIRWWRVVSFFFYLCTALAFFAFSACGYDRVFRFSCAAAG